MIALRRLATVTVIAGITLTSMMPRLAVADGASTTSTSTITPPSFSSPPLYSLAANGGERAGINAMITADFNGDGTPDLATAPFGGAAPGVTKQTGVSVYLGKGNGTFAAPLDYPAGLYPYDVVTARLRGKNAPLDLIVSDEGATSSGKYTVAVLLGNGKGAFAAPRFATIPFPAITMAVGDFNGDGKPDLAISSSGIVPQTGTGGPEELTILLGNGNGTFGAPQTYVAGDGTSVYYDMAVGDFNHDGKLDVLGMDPDGLWLSLGNGDGTFKPAALVWADPTSFLVTPTAGGPVSIVVADLNGDGLPDVAVNIDGARIDVLLGTLTGALIPSPLPEYQITGNQTGQGGGSIAAADVTGDGKLDLVVSTGYGATLGVLRGNGDGTFQSPVIYPLPEYDPGALVVTDVNRDGKPDIVVGTNLGTLAGDVNFLTVLLNKGGGTFTEPRQFPVVAPYDNSEVNPTNPVGVALGDFNGDRKPDLVVTEFDIPVESLTNGQVPAPPTVNVNNESVDTKGTIAVLLGNGDGTFGTEHQYEVGGRPVAVATGDLNRDGKTDIVVANAYSNTLSILAGNGDGTFQPAITIPVGANPNSLVLADFNRDGKPDIGVTNLADNTVSILINTSTPGAISFRSPVTYPVGTWPDAIVAADFNKDGKLDLAVANDGTFYPTTSPSTLSILIGRGDGTFRPAQTRTMTRQWGADALVAGDFSGTGRIDLAMANFTLGQVVILQGNNTGGFTPTQYYLVGAGPESIAATDFNGDGHLDLAVENLNDDTIAVLAGKGDGTFIPVASRATTQPLPYGMPAFGYPAYIAAGALTPGCRPDIVATNLFNETVTVLRNTTLSLTRCN